MPTPDPLEIAVDTAVYEAMLKTQPTFVAAIRDLLAAGQTPTQIERQMRRRFGNIQAVRNVRHVADHIQRTEAQQPADDWKRHDTTDYGAVADYYDGVSRGQHD